MKFEQKLLTFIVIANSPIHPQFLTGLKSRPSGRKERHTSARRPVS
ncbi:MAG: hypothetical protein ACYCSS_06765 [Sulfuriferula sp.]